MKHQAGHGRVGFGLLLLMLVPLTLLGLVTAGWRASGPWHDGTLSRGVIRVGYAVEPPYALVASGGNVTGESPETARLVATQLGLQIEWVQTSFGSLIPELLNGRFDVIAAGMFVTRERSKQVTFSDPTLRVRPGLLVPKGNPAAISTYADLLSQRTLRIAVLAGSVEERRLSGLGLPPAQFIRVPDAQSGCTAVSTGQADAFALSFPSVRSMNCHVTAVEGIPIAGAVTEQGTRNSADDYVAFAFAPSRTELIARWNQAQAQVVASRARLAAIAPFGFTPDDIPQGSSIKPVGAP